MVPLLRPELKTEPLNLLVEKSLSDKVEAYAKANGVSKGQVVRFALQNFFASDYENSVVSHDEFVEGEENGTRSE